MFWEFAMVVFGYMFMINFIMKKVGGAEMRVLEKDIKKHLDAAKKGDEKALKKLNALNSKRMKMAMKSQMYLLPIVIPTIFFIKSRYAEFTMTILGRSFGWLGSFFIIGILASMVSDKIVRRILKYH